MLRLFDKDNRDITNKCSVFCDNPACLGEPWCSAWGICQGTSLEPNESAGLAPNIMQQEARGSGHKLSESSSFQPPEFSPTPVEEEASLEDYYDQIFGKLSQQLTDSSSQEPSQTPLPESLQQSSSSRFAAPKTNKEIVEARKEAVPKKTRQDTEYCIRVWESWRENRNYSGSDVPLLLEMDSVAQAYWLTRCILEVRKQDGKEYPPNSLHHIICGIMRHVRCFKPEVDFFKDNDFSSFRSSLNAEMKRLQSKGLATLKQAEPLTEKEEELLWEKKFLGEQSPQILLNTMIFMNGLYFALRSGEEHRNLRHTPCQIEVVERQGERSYLKYTEDISKNHPGGLKGRKVKPKIVTHHANIDNPARCFVRLFKLYRSLCPLDGPPNAFYLSPLKNHKTDCWFSTAPIGKFKLSKAITNMCKDCGIQGYKTNHSLRATAATRLYSSGVDEQLVMERTGHHSIEGVYALTSAPQWNKRKQCPIF